MGELLGRLARAVSCAAVVAGFACTGGEDTAGSVPGAAEDASAGDAGTGAADAGAKDGAPAADARGEAGPGANDGGPDGLLARLHAVAVGQQHACALGPAGLKCWGENGLKQLADPARIDFRQMPGAPIVLPGDVMSISAGGDVSCALSTVGDVLCWGKDIADIDAAAFIAPTRVTLPSPAAQVTVGRGHACALASGSVYCWGSNTVGQLGREPSDAGTEVSRPVGVVSGLSGVVTVAAGPGLHVCALVQGGQVSCWGRNDQGELGVGSVGGPPRYAPSPVVFSGSRTAFVALAPGSNHTCAVTDRGTVRCWGSNTFGQLGSGQDGLPRSSVEEDVPGLGRVSALASGELHTCAVAGGEVFCWGRNRNGQLGLGTEEDRFAPTRVPELRDAVDVAAGGATTCVRRATGEVLCFGSNVRGQCGNGRGQFVLEPRLVDLPPVKDASLASHSGCFLLTDGSLRCTGELEERSRVPRARPLPAPVSNVAVGAGFACAFAGKTYCWGTDTAGQLGNGTVAGDSSAPAEVSPPLTEAGSSVVAFGFNACVRGPTRLHCWGQNAAAHLVFSDREVQSPKVALDETITAFAIGDQHACALGAGGVRCYGENFRGQLGAGSTATAPAVPTGLGSGVTSISAGVEHTCAVVAGGGVRCWGSNTYGELGIAGGHRNVPTDVPGFASGVVAVAAGRERTLALTASGSVVSWGGDLSKPAPGPVPGLPANVVRIGAYYRSNHAITADGKIYVWGENLDGQLGVGDDLFIRAPTSVIGL